MNKEVFKMLIKEGQEELQDVKLYERPFEFEEQGRPVKRLKCKTLSSNIG